MIRVRDLVRDKQGVLFTVHRISKSAAELLYVHAKDMEGTSLVITERELRSEYILEAAVTGTAEERQCDEELIFFI